MVQPKSVFVCSRVHLVWAACEGDEFIGISFVGIVVYGCMLTEGH